MCMEDIRIGRDLAPSSFAVALTKTVPTPVCPVDPKRARLILSSDGADLIWVGPKSLGVVSGLGFTLSIANPVLVVTVEQWGKLIWEPWIAVCNALTAILVVADVSLERS